jgi:hypothetical protein
MIALAQIGNLGRLDRVDDISSMNWCQSRVRRRKDRCLAN